jgi:hypothetical protein
MIAVLLTYHEAELVRDHRLDIADHLELHGLLAQGARMRASAQEIEERMPQDEVSA